MHILATKALLFFHRRKKGKAQTRVTALLGPLPAKPTSSFLVHLCFLYLLPEAALSPSPPSGAGAGQSRVPGAFPESGTDRLGFRTFFSSPELGELLQDR